MPATGSAYLKDGSGTRQPGPYTNASICSGCAGAGKAKPCSIDRRERQDRRLRQLPAAVAELVEGAGHPEGDEDVDVALPSVAEREEQLDVAARHPQQGPAAAPQLALDPVGLEDQVRRRPCVAQVADVGVGVVGDHRAVADRAEQGAVVEVGLQAAALARGRAARAGCRPGSRRGRRRRSRRRRGTGGRPCRRPGAAPAGPRWRPGPRRSRGSRPRRRAPARPTASATRTRARPSRNGRSTCGHSTRTPPRWAWPSRAGVNAQT